LRREGSFAFKRVEDDALEKIAEGDVFLFGDGFKDFEHAFFEANTGLDALDFDEVVLFSWHVYQVTRVFLYMKGVFGEGRFAWETRILRSPPPNLPRFAGPLVHSGPLSLRMTSRWWKADGLAEAMPLLQSSASVQRSSRAHCARSGS